MEDAMIGLATPSPLTRAQAPSWRVRLTVRTAIEDRLTYSFADDGTPAPGKKHRSFPYRRFAVFPVERGRFLLRLAQNDESRPENGILRKGQLAERSIHPNLSVPQRAQKAELGRPQRFGLVPIARTISKRLIEPGDELRRRLIRNVP